MSADILNLIGSYGFPIFCTCVMGWYVNDQTNKNRDAIEKINNQHKAEMSEITTALNNNTMALEKLCILIGGKEHD